jgi:predicted alpha/beta-hydrolase family hydrolase
MIKTIGGLPAIIDRPADGDGGSSSVLLTHGAGGDSRSKGLGALAEALYSRGHLVVRFDLPFKAEGRKTPPKAERSVDAYREVFEEARSLMPGSPWAVGGKSYGGRVASLAVAGGMEASGLLFYGYPLHAPGRSAQPRVDHFGEIGVPCLFLQGTHDALCDLEVLESHLGDLGGPATLELVQGGDHSLKVSAKRSGSDASDEGEILSELAPKISKWLESLEAP